MNPRIKEATPMNACKLKLVFTNGEQGIYDCSHLLDFGVFKELRDNAYHQQITALDGTFAWQNEQDISLDTLYLDS